MFIDKVLDKIIQVLQNEFPVKKVYLFGSRADGTAKSESDYDLLFIVSKSDITPIERAQKAHQALWDANVYDPADIFIYTDEEFEEGRKLFDSIPEIASSLGREVPVGTP